MRERCEAWRARAASGMSDAGAAVFTAPDSAPRAAAAAFVQYCQSDSLDPVAVTPRRDFCRACRHYPPCRRMGGTRCLAPCGPLCCRAVMLTRSRCHKPRKICDDPGLKSTKTPISDLSELRGFVQNSKAGCCAAEDRGHAVKMKHSSPSPQRDLFSSGMDDRA